MIRFKLLNVSRCFLPNARPHIENGCAYFELNKAEFSYYIADTKLIVSKNDILAEINSHLEVIGEII